MSRIALMVLVASFFTLPVPAGAPSAHLDRTVLKGECGICHSGHGLPQSPMLASFQSDLCLSCHGAAGGANPALVAGSASPRRLPMGAAYQHRVDRTAFSRHEDGVVCTSCHSPHRRVERAVGMKGEKRRSTRDPDQFEFELCGRCHGRLPGTTVAVGRFVGVLLDPASRSFHPVEGPAVERSPSIDPMLSGREINCTDCHGSDDPAGARGPHGSSVPHILRAAYASFDGQTESPETYALCFSCHERESILRGESFPAHAKHVVELRVSCSSCHDAHGSVHNRALVVIAEDTASKLFAPSRSSGRLAFESDGPGSGACWLTCHGHDHGPEAYGPMELLLGTSRDRLTIPPPPPSRRRSVTRPSG